MNRWVFKNAQDDYQSDYAGINLGEDLQALQSLNNALREVVGQETACDKVRESLFGCLRRNTTGPLASLLFVGPSAAGKSFTAEKIAIAFDRPYKFFDLSTFSNRDTAVIELTGLDRSYKGAEPGALTGFLANNPYSLIVLENIDKMDGASSIITNLLKGNVHDAYFDTEVSSKDAIIIMTVTAEIPPKRKISLKSILSEIDSVTNRPLLPSGIVSCIGENNIVVFNELMPFDIYNIVMAEIDKRVDSLNECYGLRLHFKPYKLAYLFTLSHAGENVRTVLSAVDSFFQQLILNISKISIKEDEMLLKCADVVINFNSSSGEAKEYLVPKISILTLNIADCKISPRRMKIFTVESATSDSSPASWFGADAVIVQVKKNNIENLKNTFKGIRCSSPIYFFASEKISLQAFKKYGTVSYSTKFSDVLNSISEELAINTTAKKLKRAQRIIKYDTNYIYNSKSSATRATLSNFRTEVAFQAADADKILAEIPNVRFDEIIGNNEAKTELASVLNMLKNPIFYLRRNITLPRAMLFQGAPGTGKTLMARALAGQCQLPFIECNATKFLQKYVGEGAKLVRELFSVARKYAPCIVFIDEIDAVVKSRDNAEDSRHTQDVTNSFLSELDGFLKYDETPVFLICATNFSARGDENTKLDKAFLRRFDRIISFDLPKLTDRKEFIQRELCKYDFSLVTDSKISEIATRSVGRSLSDLSHVIQNAVRCCECDGEFRLTDGVFNEAFESYSSGARKIYDAETIRRTALHEAGHAVVAAILGFKPAYTTIISRCDYGGFMQYEQDENKIDFTRQELLNKICVAFAGRAAEEHFYQGNGITTGAASDLKAAVAIAKNMVSEYGMESDLIYCVEQEEDKAEAVSTRVQRIITEQYERAKKLICEHSNRVKVVAEALIEEESLSEERLKELL